MFKYKEYLLTDPFRDNGPVNPPMTESQQIIMADILANPKLLFTPQYAKWRRFIKQKSPGYVDRLWNQLSVEDQDYIYKNYGYGFGALSQKTQAEYGANLTRRKTNEASSYVLPPLVATAAAPFAIEGAVAAPAAIRAAGDAFIESAVGKTAIPFFNQYVKTPLEMVFTTEGAINLASENGVRKTINHVRNGEYGDAAWNALGDAFDLSVTNVAGKNAANTILNEVKRQRPIGYETNIGLHSLIDSKKQRRNSTNNQFNSELDWSPKGWFEDAAGRRYMDGRPSEYNDSDIRELSSHVPEYHTIEQKAKSDGTWLKMPDGTKWEGDERSWVQLQSNNVKKDYDRDVFWSGREHEFNPYFQEEVWGVRGQGKTPMQQARTYTTEDKKVLPLISEKVPTIEYDAQGSSWRNLWNENVTTLDLMDRDFKEGAKRVHINNVIDPGENSIPPYSFFGDGYNNLLKTPQNDVILAPNVTRKSLIGNNGAFNKKNNNAYRGVFNPFTVGYSVHVFDEHYGSER